MEYFNSHYRVKSLGIEVFGPKTKLSAETLENVVFSKTTELFRSSFNEVKITMVVATPSPVSNFVRLVILFSQASRTHCIFYVVPPAGSWTTSFSPLWWCKFQYIFGHLLITLSHIVFSFVQCSNRCVFSLSIECPFHTE